VKQQECEQRPEPLPVQANRTAILDDRQGSENAEFDGDRPFVAAVAIAV
jgi:hypothetical protein